MTLLYYRFLYNLWGVCFVLCVCVCTETTFCLAMGLPTVSVATVTVIVENRSSAPIRNRSELNRSLYLSRPYATLAPTCRERPSETNLISKLHMELARGLRTWNGRRTRTTLILLKLFGMPSGLEVTGDGNHLYTFPTPSHFDLLENCSTEGMVNVWLSGAWSHHGRHKHCFVMRGDYIPYEWWNEFLINPFHHFSISEIFPGLELNLGSLESFAKGPKFNSTGRYIFYYVYLKFMFYS